LLKLDKIVNAPALTDTDAAQPHAPLRAIGFIEDQPSIEELREPQPLHRRFPRLHIAEPTGYFSFRTVQSSGLHWTVTSAWRSSGSSTTKRQSCQQTHRGA
jgi:hypothetical protein